MADFEGQLRWAVQQGSEWAFGPVLGWAYAEAVLGGWQSMSYSPGTVYTNPEMWA